MTNTKYLSTLTSDTAGTLATAGCRIWAAHAHNQRPVIIASLPARLSAEERRRTLAKAWQAPVTIEWRVG